MATTSMNSDGDARVRAALGQWRDSLVNLSGNNRLLNYRKLKTTLEFSETPSEVHEAVASAARTFILGTRLPETATPSTTATAESSAATSDDMERAVLSKLADIDIDKYPDALRVDETQMVVDRAVRQLATKSKSEFIDKGLHTLYLALGELRWKESSGDARRSPLLLIPATLDSNAPKERFHLRLTDGDHAVNPALAIQLAQDYGLSLPSNEEATAALDESGIDGFLDLIRAVNWPEGWEVREFSALGNFMFAKEAMYRDLLENESAIAASPIVQALSGGTGPRDSGFNFDPHSDATIDTVAPPEATPLVLDADSSQRAAVQAAVEGKSFTLDGPPGTGKSQTIANIIGGLIAAGKSVLFVSEKAVALDVVRDRLGERGLSPFLFELHSAKATRKEVAADLGNALATVPVPPKNMSATQLEQLRDAREALSAYATAANEAREPLGLTFFEVLGLYEKSKSPEVGPALGVDPRKLTSADLAAVENLLQALQPLWDLHLQGQHATWYGLTSRVDVRYPLRQLQQNLQDLRPLMSETRELRTAFGLNSLDGLRIALNLQERWHAEPDFHSEPWLHLHDLDSVNQAIADVQTARQNVMRVEANATAEFGDVWPAIKELAVVPEASIPRSLPTLLGLPRDATGGQVSALRDALDAARRSIIQLSEQSSRLAALVGAPHPRSFGDVQMLAAGVEPLLGSARPQAAWVTDAQALSFAEQVAAQTRQAEEALRRIGEDARSVFNESVLAADRLTLQKLVDAHGSLSRFNADDRTLRRKLSEFSELEWKVALQQAPLALAWFDANAEFRSRSAEARRVLHPYYREDAPTDWDRLSHSFASARRASTIPFQAPGLVEQLIHNPGAQREVAACLHEVHRRLAQWAAEHQAIVRSGDLTTGDFGVVDGWLRERALGLGPVTNFLQRQESILNAHAPYSVHLRAADTRAECAAAEGLEGEAQANFSEVAREHGLSVSPAPADLAWAQRQLQWVLDLRSTWGRASIAELPLTTSQVEALRNSRPTTLPLSHLDEYDSGRGELIRWFSKSRQEELDGDLNDLEVATELVELLSKSIEGRDDWFELQDVLGTARAQGLSESLDYARTQRLGAAETVNLLWSTIYRAWLDAQLSLDARLSQHATSRDDLVARFRELDSDLADAAVSSIVNAAVSRRPSQTSWQAALITREAEKKRKHIPVRDLVSEARDVILALHPCFMMSPLAVSQFLPTDIKFDVVIFDEASQVSPSDAINCVYRGSALITAGDQKQLPPTSFFQQSVDESDEEEDLANDFESVLDLMKGSGSFTTQTLRWHYRSRHEHLIAYSNTSFYDNRLVTFPGAVSDSVDAGVHFYKVPGIYQRGAGRNNPIEARHVAERVIAHMDSRPGKTVGVVAFSTAQRDTIETALELARAARPDLDDHFGDDRSQGVFVKSLEEVQGDERDVIIFSIGYGPDEQGRIYKQFGPVIRSGGERRLNVAITRAKELVEVVTSMSAADIGDVASDGGRHLRRYLDFAERGPSALSMELGPQGLDTESPFEDAVVDFVRSLGYDVQPQVGVAGYRIDIGVKHPGQPGAFMLGIECDGAMYHSSKAARDRDRLRHQVLEGLGWSIHHIWGTAWYRQPDKEKQRLKSLLAERAKITTIGRIVEPESSSVRPRIEMEVVASTRSDYPEWVEEYQVAEATDHSSLLDFEDVYNPYRLRRFVDEVARIETPLHFEVLAKRLREYSGLERVGKKIRETLHEAVRLSDAEIQGDFIYAGEAARVPVRRPTEDFSRTIDHVSTAELQRAVYLLAGDSVTTTVPLLTTEVASIYGWQTGRASTIDLVERIVTELLEAGHLQETPRGIQHGETPPF